MAAGARCRNEGADYLAKVNAYSVDADIEYNDDDHLYWYKGMLAPVSATAAIKKAFKPDDEFDPDATIERWFGKWMRDGAKSEYYPVLQQYKEGKITREEAAEAIKVGWSTAGPLGTEMHRLIEIFLNEQAMDPPPPEGSVLERHAGDLTDDVKVEFEQFQEWWRSWAVPRGMRAHRTELSVVWLGEGGRFVCAGQIDGVLRDKDGEYYIFDWKRVKPKKLLTVFERAYRDPVTKQPQTAAMFPEIPLTDFHKYSFQASIYSVMMKQSHGIDAGNRLRVVRMHYQLGEAQYIECADYREQAKVLLAALEQEQIEADGLQRDRAEEPNVKNPTDSA